jgi:hypothetical protein
MACKRNGWNVVARSGALHATNRGSNAGDHIASNTTGRADLARLAAAELPGSAPKPGQAIACKPLPYIFARLGPSTPQCAWISTADLGCPGNRIERAARYWFAASADTRLAHLLTYARRCGRCALDRLEGLLNLADAQIAWPVPQRLPALGDLETIGYQDGVVPPIAVRLAHPGAPLYLHAEADYASCKEVCIPYHAGLDLWLSAGFAQPGPEAPLLAAARARVPDASASR